MVTLAAYLDDISTTDMTKGKCHENILKIIDMFQSLGFVIHPEKSTLEPTTSLEFLGFIIDSRDMTVSLTQEKKVALKTFCIKVLNSSCTLIR